VLYCIAESLHQPEFTILKGREVIFADIMRKNAGENDKMAILEEKKKKWMEGRDLHNIEEEVKKELSDDRKAIANADTKVRLSNAKFESKDNIGGDNSRKSYDSTIMTSI
jgi:pectate lyase